MNKPSLTHAYTLLLDATRYFPDSTVDIAMLRSEARESDAELARDEELFKHYLNSVNDAIRSDDIDALRDSLMYLRIHAINISTIFTNLVEAIEEVAFGKGDQN